MPFAAALSEHHRAVEATGEVVGQVLERVGAPVDLAVLFVTAPFAGALEDIAGAVRTLLRPHALIGASAVSVVGGNREVEERPAVSLFAASLPSRPRAVFLDAEQRLDSWHVEGVDDDLLADARSMLLLGDPFSFPVDAWLAHLRSRHPSLAVVGGMASAARGPGGNRLVIDERVVDRGAAAVLLGEDVAPGAVVSQGCRPIGDPWIVTNAHGNVIDELAGRPALERLVELLDALSPEERELAARGLHCGIVVDEGKLDFGRGDFLVRAVLGADRSSGAVAVGDVVAVGTTVQFQVRDAVSADEDLRLLLHGRSADAALVFTCNGRGTHLFGVPHHDAAVVSELLHADAIAGMFCAGEVGPIGGRNALHGFTAAMALFNDSADPAADE